MLDQARLLLVGGLALEVLAAAVLIHRAVRAHGGAVMEATTAMIAGAAL
jgi:hypothetical protein